MKVPVRDLAGATIGLELALSVILTAAAGRWADQHFHTDPKLTIAGFVLGSIAGFRSVYRFATRDERRRKKDPPP